MEEPRLLNNFEDFSSSDEEEDEEEVFSAVEEMGIVFEGMVAVKAKSITASKKTMSSRERRQKEVGAKKTTAIREVAAAAKKAANSRASRRQQKMAANMESHLAMEVSNPALDMVTEKSSCQKAPLPAKLRMAKTISDEEYLKCFLVNPELPKLEPIRMDINKFDALKEGVIYERIVLIPEVVEAEKDGIVKRVVKAVRRVAARAVKFVKKVAKKVHNAISF